MVRPCDKKRAFGIDPRQVMGMPGVKELDQYVSDTLTGMGLLNTEEGRKIREGMIAFWKISQYTYGLEYTATQWNEPNLRRLTGEMRTIDMDQIRSVESTNNFQAYLRSFSKRDRLEVQKVMSEAERLDSLGKRDEALTLLESLTGEQKRIYNRVRKQTLQGLDQLKAEVKTFINNKLKAVDFRIANATNKEGETALLRRRAVLINAIKKVDLDFKLWTDKPAFFPHIRLGNHTYTEFTTNEDGSKKIVHFERLNSHKAAIKLKRQRSVQFPNRTSAVGLIASETKQNDWLPPGTVGLLNNPDTFKEVGINSFDKFSAHLRKKEFIPGNIDGDLELPYIVYLSNLNKHLKRLRVRNRVYPHLNAIKRDAKRLEREKGADITTHIKLFEWAKEAVEFYENPGNQHPIITGFTFMLFFGANMAQPAVNLTQLAFTTFPALSARFGNVKAGKVLNAKMASVAANALKLREYTPEELDIITAARNLGALQNIFEHEDIIQEFRAGTELSQKARVPGPFSLEAGQYLFLQGVQKSAFAFRASEVWMRSATFFATYELAKENGIPKQDKEILDTIYTPVINKLMQDNPNLNKKEATLLVYSMNISDRTLFNYNTTNRAKMFRGWGAPIWQYKSFINMFIHFLANERGKEKGLLLYLAAVGFLGLPFSDIITEMLNLTVKKAKNIPHYDAKLELKEFFTELVGGDYADLMMYGLSHSIPMHFLSGDFGYGNLPDGTARPGSISLSHRIGMHNPFPGITEIGNSGLAEAAVKSITPGTGWAYNALNSFIRYRKGDMNGYRAAENAIPNTQIKAGLQALRYAKEGAATSSSPGGAMVVDFDFSKWSHRLEVLAKFLNFPVTRVTNAWEQRRWKNSITRAYAERQTGNLSRFYDSLLRAARIAVESGEEVDIGEPLKVLNDIVEDNEAISAFAHEQVKNMRGTERDHALQLYLGLQLTGDEMDRSMVTRFTRQAKTQQGISHDKEYQILWDKVESLIPTAGSTREKSGAVTETAFQAFLRVRQAR